jgi:hypothetical protein
MTDDQLEMYDLLVSLSEQVERGEIAGLALGIITPAKFVQVFVLGSCSREPVLTLGVVRLMSRYVEDDMLSPPPPDVPPPKTRKS